MTCSNSSALTAADSSLLAVFDCTTLEICPTASATCEMEVASAYTASVKALMAELDSMTSVSVFCRESETSLTI